MDRVGFRFPFMTPSLLFVQLPVYPRDLRDPSLALEVIERHDLFVRPVQVVSNEGYLLVQPVPGVADHSPTPLVSTSNLDSQCGQVTPIRLWPFSLMFL